MKRYGIVFLLLGLLFSGCASSTEILIAEDHGEKLTRGTEVILVKADW